MKRTQLLLKEEHHSYISQQAIVNSTSISEIVRRLIDEKMEDTSRMQAKGGMEMAETAGEGPSDSKHHDEVIY